MARHTHWAKLWWAILQQFGKECYRTWRSEVTSTLAGAMAGALTDYFRTQGHSAFQDAVFSGTIGAAVVFILYGCVHLVQAVWLEHKSDTHGTTMQGLGGALVVLVIVAAFGAGGVLAYRDARATLTLKVPLPDMAQMKDLTDCKTHLAAFDKPESSNSLRRKVWRLADQMQQFWVVKRKEAPSPVLGEDQQTTNQKMQKWMQASDRECNEKFKDKILGVVQEVEARGVNTKIHGWLDYSTILVQGQRCPTQDEFEAFRELGFHMDSNDNRIEIQF